MPSTHSNLIIWCCAVQIFRISSSKYNFLGLPMSRLFTLKLPCVPQAHTCTGREGKWFYQLSHTLFYCKDLRLYTDLNQEMSLGLLQSTWTNHSILSPMYTSRTEKIKKNKPQAVMYFQYICCEMKKYILMVASTTSIILKSDVGTGSSRRAIIFLKYEPNKSVTFRFLCYFLSRDDLSWLSCSLS